MGTISIHGLPYRHARGRLTHSWVVAVVGGGAVGIIVAVGGLWAGVGLAVLASLALLSVIDEQWAVLVFVLGLIFVDRSPIMIHQSFVRLYQVFSLPIIGKWVIVRVVRRESIYWPRGWHWPLLWMTSFWLAWPHVISHSNFFVEVVGTLYLWVLGIVVFDVIRRHRLEQKAVTALSWSGIVVTLSGLVQYALFFAHILHPSLYGGFVRPYGLMREPDWYGVVSGITILLILHERRKFGKWGARLLAAAAVVGLLASLARASWVATAVAVAILALWPGPDRVPARRLIVAVIISLIAMTMIVAMVNMPLFMRLAGRLTPVSSGQAASAHVLAQQAWASRVGSIRLMWELFLQYPLVGAGAGVMGKLSLAASMDRLYAGGGTLNTGRAAANVILSQLASVGIVGLLPFAAWFVSSVKKGLRFSPWLGSALILCLVDFQFNSGTGFGFFWVFMVLASMGTGHGNVHRLP